LAFKLSNGEARLLSDIEEADGFVVKASGRAAVGSVIRVCYLAFTEY
jgi:hypothetical protein